MVGAVSGVRVRHPAAPAAPGGSQGRGPRTEREARWSGPGRARPAQPQGAPPDGEAHPVPKGRRYRRTSTPGSWRPRSGAS